MEPTTFKAAPRVLSSLLSALEKRCLIWLAERLPSRVNSDHLTALAFVSMLAAGAAYALARWDTRWLVGVVFALAANWFGDSLDGTLARVRHHERPRYGFYVDHVLDAFGMLALMGGLALSGYMSPLVAAAVVIGYYLVSIEVFLATYALGRFRITFWNLGPTELRILLAFGTLMLYTHPTTRIFGRELLVFDVGGAIGAVGLMATAARSTWVNGRDLYRAEPLPKEKAIEERKAKASPLQAW